MVHLRDRGTGFVGRAAPGRDHDAPHGPGPAAAVGPAGAAHPESGNALMRRRGERGFTLLELIIALAIVGALLAVAFGGLRGALAAWTQGEDRAEAHQHLRSIALILSRALAGGYPHRPGPGLAPPPLLPFPGPAEPLQPGTPP